jgi:hypothetical protein
MFMDYFAATWRVVAYARHEPRSGVGRGSSPDFVDTGSSCRLFLERCRRHVSETGVQPYAVVEGYIAAQRRCDLAVFGEGKYPDFCVLRQVEELLVCRR